MCFRIAGIHTDKHLWKSEENGRLPLGLLLAVLFEKQELRTGQLSQFTLNFFRLLNLFKCDTGGIHPEDDQQGCQNFTARKAVAKKGMNYAVYKKLYD